MAVTNNQTISGGIYVPILENPYLKIIITADDGTDYTISDTYNGSSASNHLITGSYTRPVSDRIGSFDLTVVNDGGRFTDKFDGGEVIQIYHDNTDGSTLRFRGKLDNVTYGLDMSKGFFLRITGRDYPEIIDKTIVSNEVGDVWDVSISGILYNFYDDITLQFWNGSAWATATYSSGSDSNSWDLSVSNKPDTYIYRTFQHKKGWNAIKSICEDAGLDVYLHYDSTDGWLLRTFIKEDITNTTSFITYGTNLLSMNGFAEDNTKIYNRIITYGKSVSDNLILLKTAEDSSSQSNLWIKDKLVRDGSLSTMNEISNKADTELSLGIQSPITGRLTSVMLNTIKPGELIRCSIPYCNINGYYKIKQFTHNFSMSGYNTVVELTNQTTKVADLFIPKINEEDSMGGVENLNNMKDSYNVYFDESPSVITHSNTEESDGKLRLQSGETSGTAITDIYTSDYDVTECELRRYENFEVVNDSYYVSNNGGITWEEYDNTGGTHNFSTPGNKLAVKLLLSRTNSDDTSPVYGAISLMYK